MEEAGGNPSKWLAAQHVLRVLEDIISRQAEMAAGPVVEAGRYPPQGLADSVGSHSHTDAERAHFYGRSRQCGRPVGARCSMGLGRNPLINGLIQHTFKINFLFLEKFTVIPRGDSI